jgi:hypothetical protein
MEQWHDSSWWTEDGCRQFLAGKFSLVVRSKMFENEEKEFHGEGGSAVVGGESRAYERTN